MWVSKNFHEQQMAPQIVFLLCFYCVFYFDIQFHILDLTLFKFSEQLIGYSPIVSNSLKFNCLHKRETLINILINQIKGADDIV